MRYGESGHFNTTTGTGLDEVTEVEARLSPSFFFSFSQGYYHYLEAWVDLHSLTPRSLPFPSNPAPVTPAGELYEIIN